jgi:hypothetical protein
MHETLILLRFTVSQSYTTLDAENRGLMAIDIGLWLLFKSGDQNVAMP